MTTHESRGLVDLTRTSSMEWRCSCGEVFADDAAWAEHAAVAP